LRHFRKKQLLVVCCPLLGGRFQAIENPKKAGLQPQAAFN
jgi:hypothetical protein